MELRERNRAASWSTKIDRKWQNLMDTMEKRVMDNIEKLDKKMSENIQEVCGKLSVDIEKKNNVDG